MKAPRSSSCSYFHLLLLSLWMKWSKKTNRLWHCFQATELLMPLLEALSNNLNISVYIVIRGKSLQWQEAERQLLHCRAWGWIGWIWGSPSGRLLKFKHLWRAKSPHGEVTVCNVINFEWLTEFQHQSCCLLLLLLAHEVCLSSSHPLMIENAFGLDTWEKNVIVLWECLFLICFAFVFLFFKWK